ncbi:MAG: hypothetical protein QME59_01070, partial [Candidatus Hydrothermarchaeota archaeon]|nr:hypothetical protein [Candidatus Hydrothermarchaeota archaeon]
MGRSATVITVDDFFECLQICFTNLLRSVAHSFFGSKALPLRTVSCYFFLRSSVIDLFPKRVMEWGGFEPPTSRFPHLRQQGAMLIYLPTQGL